jgi:hypothetical protein
MSRKTLENRVAELERRLDEMTVRKSGEPGPEDWVRSVGMFTGNAFMKEIDAAGRSIRETERRVARRGQSGTRE